MGEGWRDGETERCKENVGEGKKEIYNEREVQRQGERESEMRKRERERRETSVIHGALVDVMKRCDVVLYARDVTRREGTSKSNSLCATGGFAPKVGCT